jgi:hypothetical protein
MVAAASTVTSPRVGFRLVESHTQSMTGNTTSQQGDRSQPRSFNVPTMALAGALAMQRAVPAPLLLHAHAAPSRAASTSADPASQLRPHAPAIVRQSLGGAPLSRTSSLTRQPLSVSALAVLAARRADLPHSSPLKAAAPAQSAGQERQGDAADSLMMVRSAAQHQRRGEIGFNALVRYQ